MAGRHDTKTYRLQIMIRDDLGHRIDEIAKEMGISRSAFCAFVLGYSVRAYDEAQRLALTMITDPELKKLFSGIEKIE